jgi:hypothetical protein
MALFGLIKEKAQITDTQRELIKKVYSDVSSPNFFKSLYFPVDSNFKKLNYESMDASVSAHAKQRVTEFFNNANRFNFLISNADILSQKCQSSQSHQIIEGLKVLSTLNYRIKRGEYILRQNDDGKWYPSIICMKTPEQTSTYFMQIISPLLKL